MAPSSHAFELASLSQRGCPA